MTSLSSVVVDYRATSRRPAWSQLPESIRLAVAHLAGSLVVAADPRVGSGFTGSYAGVVTTRAEAGSSPKAGAPNQPHVVAALEQEARVLEALPHGIPAPRLLGFTAVDGWSVLLLSVVAGRMPEQPWTPDDVDAVHRACLVMADLGTPWHSNDPALGHRLSTDPQILGVGRELAGDCSPAVLSSPWLHAYGSRVGELVLGAAGRFDGEILCHGDLRPDNLMVSSAAGAMPVATVVDWNWSARPPRGGLGGAAAADGRAGRRHRRV